jgi:hypothetical protein
VAKQRVIHGAMLDIPTVGDIAKVVGVKEEPRRIMMRMGASMILDGTGSGTETVYEVPMGSEFGLRRIELTLGSIVDPNSNAVNLATAGAYIILQRSGTLMEYLAPKGPSVYNAALPGVQSWGDEQGPFLRNGEALEVRAFGLGAGASLQIFCQGTLVRPVYDR